MVRDRGSLSSSSSFSERWAWSKVVNPSKSDDVECYCHFRAGKRTSWTWKNSGRRFFNCAQKGRKCGFFKWMDPLQNEEEKEATVKMLYNENIALRKKVVWLRQKITKHGGVAVDTEVRGDRVESCAHLCAGVGVEKGSGWNDFRSLMLGGLLVFAIGFLWLLLQ